MEEKKIIFDLLKLKKLYKEEIKFKKSQCYLAAAILYKFTLINKNFSL